MRKKLSVMLCLVLLLSLFSGAGQGVVYAGDDEDPWKDITIVEIKTVEEGTDETCTHDWANDEEKGYWTIIKEPTIEENGKAERECTSCNMKQECVLIHETEHNYGELIEIVPPTCTVDGMEPHYECSICHKLFIKDETGYVEKKAEDLKIPATGIHTYDQEVANAKYLKSEATCTEPAVYYKSCECGEKGTDDDTFIFGESLGHAYGDLIEEVPATCSKGGMLAHYQCSRCSKFFVLEDGTYVEKSEKELEIDASGEHTYDQEVVDDRYLKSEATCTEPAVYYKSCICGEKGTDNDTFTNGSALGHDWDEGEVTKAPTCKADGVRTYHCKRCKETKTEVIKSPGHKVEIIPAIAPTCTKSGKTKGEKCSVCGVVITKQQKLPALGHDWDDGVIIRRPTSLVVGRIKYTCKRCQKTRVEDLPINDVKPDKNAVSKLGTNGKGAMKQYNIGEACIFVAGNSDDSSTITDICKKAASMASSGKMYMVYVPTGTHVITGYIGVPANVVLVSEKSAVYVPSKKDKTLCFVSGCVYGGTWDGKNKINTILWFNYVKFSGKNGEIRNTIIKNALIDGVHYGSGNMNKKLGGAKVIGNKISNCKSNGITGMNNGNYALIENNTINKVGTGKSGSGISITFANVGIIRNNKISNTKGHGISTDTEEPATKLVQKTVTINLVEGNKITNTGYHGIYVENKVVIKKVKNNTITKSKKCGIVLDFNGKINMLEGNTIKNCKLSNITLKGKKSYLVIGSKNTIQNSKTYGLMVNDKAKVIIKGTGNVFTKNHNDVRVHNSKAAKLTIKNKKKNKFGKIYYY